MVLGRIAILLGVIAGTTPMTAWGQGIDGRLMSATVCSLISDSLQRLTCFDRIFPKADAPPTSPNGPTEPVSGSYGLWTVQETKSAIDDSPKVLAYLGVSGQDGFTVTQMGMSVRCFENTTSVVVSTDNFAFGSKSGKVTIRIDDQPAFATSWEMADDGHSVGLWNGVTAIPFLKSIRDAKKLAFRVVLNKQSDLVFEDVSGVAAVVDRVAEACQWPAAK